MIFKQCGPLCPETCGNNETSQCGNQFKSICKRGCFCPDNEVLYNGTCIDPVDCPPGRSNLHIYILHMYMQMCYSSLQVFSCTIEIEIVDDPTTREPLLSMGDPHFMVPLLSKEVLCYSIQGYPGLAFNLIYNKNFVINALFINSIEDKIEATWIGKLAVIPKSSNKSDAIIFDSVNQEVIMVGQGKFKAEMIDKIVFSKDGNMSVKFTTNEQNKGRNPTIHVTYAKPLANFGVKFYKNHLDVNWDIIYENVSEIYGLMGEY